MQNVYRTIIKIGLAQCKKILENAPADPPATHYYNQSYYEQWTYGSWVKFENDQLVDVPQPPKDERIDLAELAQAFPQIEIIEKLGGVTKAREDVKMARIMRTMYVGDLDIHDIELAINHYETYVVCDPAVLALHEQAIKQALAQP